MSRLDSSPWTALLLASAIFALNAYFCANLFGLEFSIHMESIEGAYMTISRWAMSNWRDLTWFPLWNNGQPFHGVYQPGFHVTVAALGLIAQLTPQHAYHLVTGLAYCAGPATLFAICFALTRRPDFSFISAVLFSLVSPVCFFSAAHRIDAGGWLWPRRYQILVHYGEGPHTTAVAAIPLVILALHAAVCLRRRAWAAVAPFAVAAVVITNWPGSMGLSMAILAYCISRAGAARRIHWPLLIGIGLVAYLIVAPWIPPSTIASVFANAQQSDGTSLGGRQLLPALVVAASLCAAHLLLSRWDVERAFRFFVYLSLITGAVTPRPGVVRLASVASG